MQLLLFAEKDASAEKGRQRLEIANTDSRRIDINVVFPSYATTCDSSTVHGRKKHEILKAIDNDRKR
jgi:hypothetical protein